MKFMYEHESIHKYLFSLNFGSYFSRENDFLSAQNRNRLYFSSKAFSFSIQAWFIVHELRSEIVIKTNRYISYLNVNWDYCTYTLTLYALPLDSCVCCYPHRFCVVCGCTLHFNNAFTLSVDDCVGLCPCTRVYTTNVNCHCCMSFFIHSVAFFEGAVNLTIHFHMLSLFHLFHSFHAFHCVCVSFFCSFLWAHW